jgi:hypothetical protein
MKRDCSTLHNVRDQLDEEDFVEERAVVPPAEYVQEIEVVKKLFSLK